MRFKIKSELDYEIKSRSTIIFSVHAAETASQSLSHESLEIVPSLEHEEFVSERGEGRFVRLDTADHQKLKIRYSAEVESHCEIVDARELERVPVQQLDHTLIMFLFPSRYCESDMLARLAFGRFGKIAGAYERVVAIADWIYENVEYVSGSTDAQTSAYDTVTQLAGVCRDFAHLGIAFCRALNIPARYLTAYAYRLDPPDFHACFEAFIGGRWIVFDATRLAPLNGLVRIATGRDAADTSVATIFGHALHKSMKVECKVVGNDFKPLTREDLIHQGVCLER